MIGVFERRRRPRHPQRGDQWKLQGGEDAVYKPGRAAPEGKQPLQHLDLGPPPPEPRGNEFLLFRPPSLCAWLWQPPQPWTPPSRSQVRTLAPGVIGILTKRNGALQAPLQNPRPLEHLPLPLFTLLCSSALAPRSSGPQQEPDSTANWAIEGESNKGTLYKGVGRVEDSKRKTGKLFRPPLPQACRHKGREAHCGTHSQGSASVERPPPEGCGHVTSPL